MVSPLTLAAQISHYLLNYQVFEWQIIIVQGTLIVLTLIIFIYLFRLMSRYHHYEF